ncbi:MAG: NUDIX domain-containing protein [Patescibacteria group bacterium]
MQNLRREVSAGGIIYRRKNGVLEFFFIRDPYGKWTFPKGHQELGETMAETAIREIKEETGLFGLKYITSLGRTSFRFRRDKSVIEKTVHLFLFEAHPELKEALPGTEGITKAAWFRADKALSMSGYRNLDRLFARALALTANNTPPDPQEPSRKPKTDVL